MQDSRTERGNKAGIAGQIIRIEQEQLSRHLDKVVRGTVEETLNARNSTMIIISHDRHFLNSVCTHMADLDYQKLTIYPGNYDDFILLCEPEETMLSARISM